MKCSLCQRQTSLRRPILLLREVPPPTHRYIVICEPCGERLTHLGIQLAFTHPEPTKKEVKEIERMCGYQFPVDPMHAVRCECNKGHKGDHKAGPHSWPQKEPRRTVEDKPPMSLGEMLASLRIGLDPRKLN